MQTLPSVAPRTRPATSRTSRESPRTRTAAAAASQRVEQDALAEQLAVSARTPATVNRPPLPSLEAVMRGSSGLGEAMLVGAVGGAMAVALAGVLGRNPADGSAFFHAVALGAFVGGMTHVSFAGTDAIRASIPASEHLPAGAQPPVGRTLLSAREMREHCLAFARGVGEGFVYLPAFYVAVAMAYAVHAEVLQGSQNDAVIDTSVPVGGRYNDTFAQKWLVGVLVCPVIEELVFREKFLRKYEAMRQSLHQGDGQQATIARIMSRPIAVTGCNALIFSLWHVRNAHKGSIHQAIVASAAVPVLQWAYNKHGLGGAVGLHFFHNALVSATT